MSANAELARIFGEMSAILELTGANAFRVNAYARASRVLNDLAVDVADIADHKQLVAIEGIGDGMTPRQDVTVVAQDAAGSASPRRFKTTLRIDTPVEIDYYRHGGILPMVLRSLLK